MSSYISAHNLLTLPVYTASGTALGRVVDAELDPEDLHVERLKVQPGGLTGLLHEHFLIHRTQIIRIEEKRIIVDDTMTPKHEPSKQASADPA